MNTNQLIILWYGSLVLVAILYFYFEQDSSILLIVLLLSVVLAVFLSYLTFRNSDEVNKAYVLKNGVLPVGIIVSLIIIGNIIDSFSSTAMSPNRTINTEEIEIIEPKFQLAESIYESKKATFSGRIRNHSNRTIRTISVRIRLYDVDYESPDIDEGVRLTPQEFFLSSGIYLHSLEGDLRKKVGKQIDTDDFRYRRITVGPGDTKSFSVNNNFTGIRPSKYWVWDYEILYVGS